MVLSMLRFELVVLSFFLLVGLAQANPALAAAPAVVTLVVPTPADRAVSLTWTNPASVDFTGTMVRYSTTAFPTSISDGTLASDVAGAVSGTSTTTVSSLTNGTTYYFSLFSHNGSAEYSAAVNTQQIAMASAFTEDFESRSLANVSGQNGWAALGGTWTVVDTAGEQTVRSSADNTIGFETNRILNGGTTATYSNQMLRTDWKGSTTNFPGQLFLRAQSASADEGGYYLWHSSGTLRLSYKTSTGGTSTALTTAAFTVSTATWYTYEFSVVNNSAGLPVLTVYAWQRGTAKPSTPTIQYTDTIPRFSQGVFSLGKSGATTAEYDNVTWFGMPGISGVTATPGDSSVVFSWTNPTYATYTGTMVRYSSSAYPTSNSDGTLVGSVTGSSGATSSVTHSSLTNGTTYYYALFPYDASGVYGTPMYIRQVAYPSLFSDTFESRSLGTISGQNGWSTLGGTWAVTDLSSNRVLLGSSDVDGYQSNKAQNGSDQATDQVLIGRFQSDNATNLAGQFWLRQQSTAGKGYNFWHSGSAWTISYVDSSQGINTALATAATTAGPAMEAGVWYNVEASAIDDGSDLPVLTLFVWKVGAEKPSTPTLQVTDGVNHYTAGAFSLGKANTSPYGYYDNIYHYGVAPALTVTSPAADVGGAPNVATISITDQGGTFYVPYIQTSTTLNVAASATGVPTGGGVEFVLNEGLVSERSSTDLSAPYTAAFTSLAKAEYTLDVYVLQADGTTRFSADDSHVERTDIAIGDIFTVIGDSVTEGSNGGINSVDPVTSWLDSDAGKLSADNRQFPQHGANTGVYNESYLSDLNDRVAAYYDYPVFFMNEGVAGIRANNYSSTMNSAWQTRQNTLVPNKWIISLGVNDAWNDYTASQTVSALTTLINTLISTYGASADAIYLNIPNYDFRTSVNAAVPVSTYLSAYPAAYVTLRSTLGLQGGANFYDVYENYQATEYQNLVHPNATGYVRMARLMALAVMKPTASSVSGVTARQATLNWSSITAEDATIAGYRVNYGTSSASLTSTATFGDVTTGTITGLEPNTTYYFSVQAFDNDPYDISYSDESNVLSTTTSTIALLSSAVTADNDGDGYLDRVVATFTKDLDGSTVAGADFSVAGYTVASASETSAGVVTIVLTEESTYDTGATPLISIAGSVSDTSGNTTTSSSVTADDSAVPMMVSISPDTNATLTRLGNIVVVFTEAMDTGTVTTSLVGSNVSLTPVWTVGNTVMTLTHVSPFTAGSSHTFTVTAGDDTSGNAFAGIVSGVHPRIFRTASSGSDSASSSSSSTATPTLSILSPNGGEQLTPGVNQQISWSSSGSGLSFVNVAYSTDGGTSFTSIAQERANLGYMTWTVPYVSSTNVKILVQAGDLSATLAQDISDSSFTILGITSSDDTFEQTTDDQTAQPEVVVVNAGQGTSPYTGLPEAVTQVAVGDYIRSPNYATVYYIDANGSRRPFVDAQTYFTYETSFAAVTTVTDATLAQLSLGAPMLPQAGSVLIKIVSDPRVYWLTEESGVSTLHWVTSEDLAKEMFGDAWADYVIDIPPTMIARFVRGADLSEAISVELTALRTRLSLTALIKAT